MLRKVFIVLVLAALAVTPALASPAASAKAHKRASRSTANHAASRSATPRTSRRAAAEAAPRSSRARAAKTAAAASVSRRATVRTMRVRGSRRGLRTEDTPRPMLQRTALHRRAVFVPMPSPLKGSLESLTRQNEIAEAEGLERILDENDLNDRIAQKLLVPVPASANLQVNDALPESHRYCRPWTADFLTELARAHGEQFHRSLYVSSAVRTVEYQKQLMRINGNAAAAEGDIVSPHLTGATIDIAKKGMNRQELAWMRSWLLPLQLSGQIDVEEEFKQACFHITVYKSFQIPGSSPRPLPLPQPRRASSTARVAADGL